MLISPLQASLICASPEGWLPAFRCSSAVKPTKFWPRTSGGFFRPGISHFLNQPVGNNSWFLLIPTANHQFQPVGTWSFFSWATAISTCRCLACCPNQRKPAGKSEQPRQAKPWQSESNRSGNNQIGWIMSGSITSIVNYRTGDCFPVALIDSPCSVSWNITINSLGACQLSASHCEIHEEYKHCKSVINDSYYQYISW